MSPSRNSPSSRSSPPTPTRRPCSATSEARSPVETV
jgi:hypothetical protein